MKKYAFAWVLATAMSSCTISAWAASLQVAPISLKFSTTENAKEIWLTNTSSQPIRAQTRVQEWVQKDGQDVLTATKNIVASPMVTEIPAGEKQLIRVIKIVNLPQSQEQTYRLIIDELPSTKLQEDRTGLQLLLQYSVPVFFQPNQVIPSRNGLTSLDQVELAYHQNTISVRNHTNRH